MHDMLAEIHVFAICQEFMPCHKARILLIDMIFIYDLECSAFDKSKLLGSRGYQDISKLIFLFDLRYLIIELVKGNYRMAIYLFEVIYDLSDRRKRMYHAGDCAYAVKRIQKIDRLRHIRQADGDCIAFFDAEGDKARSCGIYLFPQGIIAEKLSHIG